MLLCVIFMPYSVDLYWFCRRRSLFCYTLKKITESWTLTHKISWTPLNIIKNRFLVKIIFLKIYKISHVLHTVFQRKYELQNIDCVIFWPFDPAKNAIQRWCTRRRWHILMAVMRGNRVGGNWLMKRDELKNSHGTLIDWCTRREWPLNCMMLFPLDDD